MKRVFALVMALALLLSMILTAFATEGEGAPDTGSGTESSTGSITITNATANKTYTIYKIFDASLSIDEGDAVADSISYTVTNQAVYKYLFERAGCKGNDFFNYEPNTKVITKKTAADNTQLINHLAEMLAALTPEELGTIFTQAKTADDATLTFDNLPYGYYVVSSTLGSAVSVTSTNPNVDIIDKNQEPAADFNKMIKNGENWDTTNTAAIGDELQYKIEWTATNYDGAHRIMHYQIHDTAGEAICLDYSTLSITKTEAGATTSTPLTKGFFLSMLDSSKNTVMGTWGNENQNPNNADWYLVQLSETEFRITMPWLTNARLENVTDPTTGKVVSYNLTYGENAVSRHNSPVTITITYSAALSPEAAVGVSNTNKNTNTAYLTWTSPNESGSTKEFTVNTLTYGIGVLKDDGSTFENLQGAEFKLYSDAECTQPVYVIPTDLQGVYVVDSLNTYGGIGNHSSHASREIFKNYLADYLGTETQKNLVVSQVNGKLIILGLNAGTYYLLETKAPNGYNALAAAETIVVGNNAKPFNVFADDNGNVANIQAPDTTHAEVIFHVTNASIHNSKGVELPSTGGTGTMMLIGIGTFMVILFSVFLITQKKMSIYRD